MLNSLLFPKKIAVIGASRNPEKLGYQIINNLLNGGFRGEVFPVNREDGEIFGLKMFKSVDKIKHKIDLAIIVIPALYVIGEAEKCAQNGIKNIIVISAGFAEENEEGKKRQELLVNLAKEYNLNILGPNCLGLVNSAYNLNATFAKSEIKKGKTAFISQSGAVGSAVLDWLLEKNYGISYFISLGNKAIINENHFLEFFKKDKNTDLIIAYLEEIEDGQKFMETVSRLSKYKPVAVLKAGKSNAAREAMLSHTGSLAGSNEAIAAGFKRSGVINLENIEEAFNLTKLSLRKISHSDNKIYIISNAGGPMIATLDSIEKTNLEVIDFDKKTKTALQKALPAIKNINNPLDLIGDARAVDYQKALEVILKNKEIKNVLVLLTPQTATEVDLSAEYIAKISNKYKNKLICASFIGGKSLINAVRILEKNSIPHFDFPSQAVKAMSYILSQKKDASLLKPYKYKKLSPKKNSKTSKFKQLDYLESFKLLKKYKINSVNTVKISNQEDFKKLKYPVALKIFGPEIIHKTDVGSIALNLKSESDALAAYKSFKKLLAADRANYCIAQPMVYNSLEMIIGFRRDQSFGPIVLVGWGGIYAEVIKDFQAEVDDLDYGRAMQMISKLKVFQVLKGARGKEGYAIEELAKTLVKLAKLSRENTGIKELDINPLFVRKGDNIAADIRIIY